MPRRTKKPEPTCSKTETCPDHYPAPAAHSPLPWRAVEEKGGARIVTDGGYRDAPKWPCKTAGVAECRNAINGGGDEHGPFFLKTPQQAQADAALIVRAVNAHEALIAAVECNMTEGHEFDCDALIKGDMYRCSPDCAKMRAALRLAKEGA